MLTLILQYDDSDCEWTFGSFEQQGRPRLIVWRSLSVFRSRFRIASNLSFVLCRFDPSAAAKSLPTHTMTDKPSPYPARSMSSHSDDSRSESEEEESSTRESNPDDSSTNTGSTGRPKESGLSSEDEIKMLSARETNNIRCWRITVLVLIISVGAAVAGAAYVFLSQQQEAQYLAGVSPLSMRLACHDRQCFKYTTSHHSPLSMYTIPCINPAYTMHSFLPSLQYNSFSAAVQDSSTFYVKNLHLVSSGYRMSGRYWSRC